MKVRLSAGVGCAVLVALLVPAIAGAATAAPTMVAAASWVAGHPVTVACDVDTNPSPFPTPPGTGAATAWTLTDGNVIHALPAFCDGSIAAVGTAQFATALDVFIHEAARAHGWSSNSCVEMLADVGVYDVLRRFYNIPFFTQESETIGAQVLNATRALPSIYQPEGCWNSGVMR